MIAGHEAAGIIEEVGQSITLVKLEDHAVVSLLRSCRRCFYCTTGSPYICEAKRSVEKEGRIHNKQGDPIQLGLRTPAFAECTMLDQSQVVAIPKNMPLDQAALLACGVITGLSAVVNSAKVRPNSRVNVVLPLIEARNPPTLHHL